MTKVLFIIPYIPYPLDSGGNQAFFHMADFLRSRMSVSILLHAKNEQDKENIGKLRQLWNDVTFFTFTPSCKEKENERTSPPVSIKNPNYYNLLTRIRNSVDRKMRRQIKESSPQPPHRPTLVGTDLVREKSTLNHSLYNTLDEEYVDYVAHVAAQGFDIIQVEFFELISLGYILPKTAQTLFVHHELRYVRNENEMSLFQKVTSSDLIRYQVSKNFERDALRQYRHIIALTETDKRKLTELLGENSSIFASPATIQINWSTSHFTPCTTNRLTFVGSEDHFPNLDAVIWFCQQVAPILRQHHFKFTFQVIGKWRGPHIAELCHSCPELEFTGFIEQLDTFLSGSITVVPVRIGSGMRMKILESVSSFGPFVTTTKGVEGIDFQHMNECLIADNPEEFASAIMQLAKEPELQHKLAQNAQTKLQHLYDSTCMQNQRLSVYNAIITH